jgi:hypothetical protein
LNLPYENATSGKTAIDDMQKIMRAFGASSFGCMEDFAKSEVIIQFEWRGQRVVLKASSKGYAEAWLKAHPYSHRMRVTLADYRARSLKLGQTAVYSILRDWVKGQVTAIEVGMLSFESAFLGQLLLPSGQTVMERVAEEKLLQIGGV